MFSSNMKNYKKKWIYTYWEHIINLYIIMFSILIKYDESNKKYQSNIHFFKDFVNFLYKLSYKYIYSKTLTEHSILDIPQENNEYYIESQNDKNFLNDKSDIKRNFYLKLYSQYASS